MRVDAVRNSEQLKVKMSISEMALTWKENAPVNDKQKLSHVE